MKVDEDDPNIQVRDIRDIRDIAPTPPKTKKPKPIHLTSFEVFTDSKNEKYGQCLLCRKNMVVKNVKMKNGNTTGLKRHLEVAHKELVMAAHGSIGILDHFIKEGSEEPFAPPFVEFEEKSEGLSEEEFSPFPSPSAACSNPRTIKKRPTPRSSLKRDKCDELMLQHGELFEKQRREDTRNETFGRRVASRLDSIQDNTQRLLAEKIIDDALFLAELGQLTGQHVNYMNQNELYYNK